MQPKNEYSYDLSRAKDAFDYPNLAGKSDTDIYVYQLKDTLNRQDSFLYVNYGSYYLKEFGEVNLSLRPEALETFRFSFCPGLGNPINITFNQKGIVVKWCSSGYPGRVFNQNKLDPLEFLKFRFLNRYFFRARESLDPKRIKFYDSMLTKYPELKSIKYYKHLIDKSTDYDSAKFKYIIREIPLSIKQYATLLDSLRRTDFDRLPWKFDPNILVNDGGGYTFEANTKTKYKFFVCQDLPVDSLPITRFCKYLLRLAKVDKEIPF